MPENPPTHALARAFAALAPERPLALWGSSSMEGGLGTEHTPRPVYVHEELANAMNPIPVTNLAYGAQFSGHTTILRGLDTPFVHIPEGYRGGRVKVRVDADVPGMWSFTCHGRLSSGVSGTLTGTPENQWFFESDGGPATSGEFTSSWKAKTETWRHVVWTGKNNIVQRERVLSDVERLVAAARTPETDAIVLGQWVTKNDLDAPEKIKAIHAVNDAQRAAYGARFVDVQALLTSEEALRAEPIASLKLQGRTETRTELDQGIVPTPLRGSDGIHLSGWGNLLVSWALIEKMKELKWMA